MGTLKRISDVYDKITADVIKSGSDWKEYLKFASGIYKYGFDNSILLYAQRPNATMVADMETWNKRVGRWINRGAKSIAVFDTAAPKLELRYLFDITDTNGTADTYPRLWKLTEQNSPLLLEKLNSKSSLSANSLKEFAVLKTLDNIQKVNADYYEGFKKTIANSPLSELDDETLKMQLDILIIQSVQYMVYCRCGFDVGVFDNLLDEISDFNNKYLLYQLGSRICSMSQEMLGEFASTLNEIIKEQKENWIKQKRENQPKIEPTPSPVINSSKIDITQNIKKQADVLKAKNIPNEQISLFEPEETADDDDNELELDVINAVIIRGNLTVGGKKLINEFFKRKNSNKECAKFLIKTYGMCGSSFGLPNGNGSWTADSRGIEYTAQNYGFDFKGFLTWSKVSQLISGLVDKDLYYEPDDDGEFNQKPETEKQDDFPYFKYNYGDFISLNGDTYEILENILQTQKIRIGNIHNNIGLHQYTLTEELPWQELEKGELIEPPANLLPKLAIDKIVNMNNRKYKITRIDKNEVNLLDITYKDVLPPQLLEKDLSAFITVPTSDVLNAIRHTEPLKQFGRNDFYNADIEYLTKDFNGEAFSWAYAAIGSERYALSFEAKRGEAWDDGTIHSGVKTAYRNYLMDVLKQEHKTATVEAGIMTEDEYENQYSDSMKVCIDDEFSLYDRTYTVINVDEHRKEVILRDTTYESEYHLPLYKTESIPFVYQRTQAHQDLTNLTAEDFLSGEIELTAMYFENSDEKIIYTYGYVTVQNAVFYMDYKVDSDWNEADIEAGKRRAYAHYLVDVHGYSDKDSTVMSGRMTAEEFDELTAGLTPISDIPHADEFINTPFEATETVGAIPEMPVISPDIPRIDYRCSSDDEIGIGGPKAKFKANVEAVRMLNAIESENRLATVEEQKVLYRYVGWGGLADAFNPENSSWSNEYKELKDLLSITEYESARASTLTAHYTPTVVIQAVYGALQSFGFKGGNVLEPALATGRFFAAMPDELRENSKMYGVEIDSVSGRIAQQLHQNANIKIQGYETTNYPDNFFDVAIGNVPFGDYKLHDPQYNKHNFLIHDYFFAKTLDKVRPGGVIAFITSKGTLDKENSSLRKYLAAKTDLIGAVRLPNNTFRQIANTEVTADIIFLQKRERIVSEEPYWIKLGETENGIPVNSYFAKNPYMMLGKMEYDNRFGEKSVTLLKSHENMDLHEELSAVIKALDTVIPDYEHDEENAESIPADPNVRNFTFVFKEDILYYRENSSMRRMDYKGKQLERIRGMCEIRDITRALIDAQTCGRPDFEIKQLQGKLNKAYDLYIKKSGYLSDTANRRVFRDDSDYPLLCSLEKYKEETKEYVKADMFTKQTIRPKTPITSVDTAIDSLKVSLTEKGRVDLKYMCSLYEVPYEVIYQQLEGQLYINPEKAPSDMPKNMSVSEFFNAFGAEIQCFETADEYLSGDVRKKLHLARLYAESNAELFTGNVQMLESVQPLLLEASEIDVKIGVNWVELDDYASFMYETFKTPDYAQRGSYSIGIEYNRFTDAFSVRNKAQDSDSVTVTGAFGTERMNAYTILEETLNLRSVTVYDRIEDADGKVTYKPNQNESILAREKQGLIKEAFKEWIFAEPDRRKKYVDYYNEHFNNIRLRKYDGSHLEFEGMTPDYELRQHQKNAVARALYSSTNELLDHKVGAGKTFVMVASCMELKRLQLAQKSIFVVPNHLTGQMGAEFLRLYPSAKILVATKKDFEKKNRLKFISKIATGDWDAVILGHSQFEKIAMSKERQIMILDRQVDDLLSTIATLRYEKGDGFTIKQMENMRKKLEEQIKELADDSKKDDLITFESLGIDYMFVDEAHYYKNCAVFSKMRNVAGINQSNAKKATDMLMKCQYINEINNGKGIVFATGTPLSNSMVEMYVMQRYLDYIELEKRGLLHFDAWAAQFGEVVSSLELAPEGTGYRYRNRFAKFINLPELLSMYHNFADVVTDEMLNDISDIHIPKIRNGKYEIVVCTPSDFVLTEMMMYVIRAEAIRNGKVKSWEDNMLKITNEARLLATDPRLIDPAQENTLYSKVSICADNVFKEYSGNMDIKGTQVVFCDIGTPNSKGKFNVYDALKKELVLKGIPEDKICFIHDAKNDVQREELFSKMRSGEMRVIIGSTPKMGTGTNIQNRLVALHHLDCPYRPSDIEQREGRALRQGNENDEVAIYRYVTQQTFDSYMWQLVENKQRFIAQIKSGKMVGRSCEDIDETVLSYAEVKAIASGDERIKEKMDLDLEIQRLQLLKANYDNQRYSLQDKFTFVYPKAIAENEQILECVIKDREIRNMNRTEEFSITLDGKIFTERESAGNRILLLAKAMKADEVSKTIGTFGGFEVLLQKERTIDSICFSLILRGNLKYTANLSANPLGNTTKLDNLLRTIDIRIEKFESELDEYRKNMDIAKTEYEKPFAYADTLVEKLKRQAELNKELDLSTKEDVVVEGAENLEEENTSDDIAASKEHNFEIDVIQQKNYKLFSEMFTDIANGSNRFMRFKSENIDGTLIAEKMTNEYSLSLYSTENGAPRTPEYIFIINENIGSVEICSYSHEEDGVYIDGNTTTELKLAYDFHNWLSEIKELKFNRYNPSNQTNESEGSYKITDDDMSYEGYSEHRKEYEKCDDELEI